MTAERDIAIVGPGKVGTAIGVLAARAGRSVVAVAGRDPARARAAAEQIGPPARACTPLEAAAACDLVLLTVGDQAIQPLCESLAEARAFRRGAVVAHCCGALPSDVLASARTSAGCYVGSMHPLQTFPTAERAVAGFGGTYCFCEGDGPAVAALMELAQAIGGRPVQMDSAGKALYHAGAAMACNHLSALMDAAAALLVAAGIEGETALAALGPLAAATLANVAEMGPAAALTGPVARGDVATVGRHLAAMRAVPDDLQAFYRAAARWTIALARRKGTIDETTAETLRQYLTSGRSNDGSEDH